VGTVNRDLAVPNGTPEIPKPAQTAPDPRPNVPSGTTPFRLDGAAVPNGNLEQPTYGDLGVAREIEDGQARGEVARQGRPENLSDGKVFAADLGVSHKQVHDWKRTARSGGCPKWEHPASHL
jgi:hypothetical protein